MVLDNLELRALLEAEPRLRTILAMFRDNKYKDVFQLLDNFLPTYRSDIYLTNQVDNLVTMIQERAILQYFTPFSSAELSKASEVFGWSLEFLQSQLINVIQQKKLDARIDLTKGVVVAHERKLRPTLFRDVIESAEAMQQESKAAILRLRLVQADLLVRDFSEGNHSSELSA